ncbi:MAG: hypothetical protein J7539_09325 [Niabella sp.]|nr:hypothetical protein [Niabella sp.]
MQNKNPQAAAITSALGYRFTIPNARILIYQVFAYSIIFLNMLGQLIMDFRRNSSNFTVSVSICALLLLLLVSWDRYLLRKKNRLQSLGIILLILGFRWYQYAMGWGFVVNVLLWFLYLVSRRQLTIFITADVISYPSFPVKKIPWDQVSNLILKDGILTIDLKNNKIYQHLVKEEDQDVSETEFNEFCRKQLKRSQSIVNGQ